MSPTVRLCGREDLKVGEARKFVVGDEQICLVRTREEFKAIGDVCSHADYSLSEGEVDLDYCEIECWKHGSMFSLDTGEPTTLPATRPVPVYQVTVDGDDVSVVLP
ncbi:MAG TPA: non-heme iron oxygenase ferredoxin subunit [Acidimicrobiales bacterium]|jgi:3-phenylpropionate/trans-cinnamate dioxygenase ferredoxin subunit|nr:non-heme iron oxygenase ferredoxin subunit [Acidimicrobiales bacterium]